MCSENDGLITLSLINTPPRIAAMASECSKCIQTAAQACDMQRKPLGKVTNFVTVDRFGTGGEGTGANNLITVVRALNAARHTQ